MKSLKYIIVFVVISLLSAAVVFSQSSPTADESLLEIRIRLIEALEIVDTLLSTNDDIPDDDPPGLPEVCFDTDMPVVSWEEYDDQSNVIIDATTMNLDTGDGSGIAIKNATNVCWQGGSIHGIFDDTWDDWDAAKTEYGLRLEDCGDISISGVTFADIGDGLKVRGSGDQVYRVDRCLFVGCRDDSIECDDLLNFHITNCLIEGHIGFAFRERSSTRDDIDGGEHLIIIENCLVRLVPQLAVYKGDVPGHGGFIKESKIDDAERRPKYILRNNIFAAEQDANYTSLSLNPNGDVIESSGNTILWLGEGSFPEAVPSGWQLANDYSIWQDAVADWYLNNF